jgi:hypothetical protein
VGKEIIQRNKQDTERKILLEKIIKGTVSPEEEDIANTVYSNFKPELVEGDEYRLIEISLYFPDFSKGYLVYSLNGTQSKIIISF